MKFEEAFHSQKGINLPLYVITNIITNIITNTPDVYENQYKHFLFCPECKQAKLSYKNANTPYLSAYPNAEHNIDCDLAQNIATQTHICELVSDYNKIPEVRQEFHRQMDSIMRILLAENNQLNINNVIQQDRDDIDQPHKQVNAKSINCNILPRKRIDLTLNDSDYGVYKIFYGNMFIRWREEKETAKYKHYYKILLYTPKTNKFKCQIKITDNVYAYLSQEIKSINGTECKIVFIGQLDKGNKTVSNNCGFSVLRNSEFIEIMM